MILEVYVVLFDQDKMILCVLINCVIVLGMCVFVGLKLVDDVFKILGGKVWIKCIMWLCWVQEYEVKINLGDLILIVEVVCDLYWMEDQFE